MKNLTSFLSLIVFGCMASACAAQSSAYLPQELTQSQRSNFDLIAKNIDNPCAEEELSSYQTLKDLTDAQKTCHEAWLLSETISFFLTNETGFSQEEILSMAQSEARNLMSPYDFKLADRPKKGPDTAAAKIVIFSDFQCPYCSRGAKTIENIIEKYPEDAQVYFKNMPLISIHPEALPAAYSAVFAHFQGKFWEVHDKYFANQKELSPSYIIKVVESLGGNVDEVFDPELGHAYGTFVAEDMKDASSAHVRGTPAFFVNGVQIEGGLSLARLSHRVEAEKTAPAPASEEARSKARKRMLDKCPYTADSLKAQYELLSTDEKQRVVALAGDIPCPCADMPGSLHECVNYSESCEGAPAILSTIMQRVLENTDENKLLDEVQGLFVKARLQNSMP